MCAGDATAAGARTHRRKRPTRRCIFQKSHSLASSKDPISGEGLVCPSACSLLHYTNGFRFEVVWTLLPPVVGILRTSRARLTALLLGVGRPSWGIRCSGRAGKMWPRPMSLQKSSMVNSALCRVRLFQLVIRFRRYAFVNISTHHRTQYKMTESNRSQQHYGFMCDIKQRIIL